ncbi:MAG: MBL fold metallo-hydrolase [Desulfobacula sp.]|nr:MBL fold metallo-hydrolase [Desulfobacula sp.]
MEIKCWGSRGSIPVSGDEYLKYGGDTTCIEITAQTGETIIVDAGTGLRRLGNSFIERDITRYYFLFTHAHWDHILGIAFFRPFLYKKVQAFIQDRKFAGINTQNVLNEVMKQPFFPISSKDLNADIKFDKSLNNKFNIGSISVESIEVSHFGGCLGYKFIENGKSFVFITDNELGFDHPESKGIKAHLRFAQDADLLFHDGEYTKNEYKRKITWGHSSVPEVLDFAQRANVARLGLFHLNQDRTDAQVDKIVDKCKIELKKTKSNIDCFAVACNFGITL